MACRHGSWSQLRIIPKPELPGTGFDLEASLTAFQLCTIHRETGRTCAHKLMQLIPASDSSLLVIFGDAISPEMQSLVLGLFHALQARGDSRIRNLHPGYVSLLVDFDPLAITHQEVTALVEECSATGLDRSGSTGNVVEIPVCYDPEFGVNLADVAAHTKLSVEDVIRLHAGATYDVCFLGFTAGFTY